MRGELSARSRSRRKEEGSRVCASRKVLHFGDCGSPGQCPQ